MNVGGTKTARVEMGRIKFRGEIKGGGATGLVTEWMSPPYLGSREGFPGYQTRPSLPLPYDTDVLFMQLSFEESCCIEKISVCFHA